MDEESNIVNYRDLHLEARNRSDLAEMLCICEKPFHGVTIFRPGRRGESHLNFQLLPIPPNIGYCIHAGFGYILEKGQFFVVMANDESKG